MRILLDECTPRIIKKRLSQFAITTVQEMGWAGIRNGDLLAKAEAQFEVFITTDKNLRHQQNRAGKKLAILQLPSNQVLLIAAMLAEIEAALTSIRDGEFIMLSPPSASSRDPSPPNQL